MTPRLKTAPTFLRIRVWQRRKRGSVVTVGDYSRGLFLDAVAVGYTRRHWSFPLAAWVARRVAIIPLAVFAASGVCFLCLHWIPGGAFLGDRLSDPVLRQNLAAAFGLDRPWWAQWGGWCLAALQGSLGESFQHRGVPVASLLSEAWPASLALGTGALLLGLALALPGALVVVRHSATRRARAVEGVADALLCLPTFVTAPLLLVASVTLPPLALADSAHPEWLAPILAVVALALPVAATAFRWLRVGLEEALGARWWPMVRTRPLSDRRRWWRYALRSSLPTLAGRMAPLTADLLTGALAVEVVFGLPGLGQLLASAALHRDAPVLLAAVSAAVVTVMTVQLVADAPPVAAGLRRLRPDPRIALRCRPAGSGT